MKARASTRRGFGVTCFQGAVESPGHPLHTSSFLAKSKMLFCYRACVVAQTLNSVPGDLESSQDLREQCRPGEPPSWSRAVWGDAAAARPPPPPLPGSVCPRPTALFVFLLFCFRAPLGRISPGGGKSTPGFKWSGFPFVARPGTIRARGGRGGAGSVPRGARARVPVTVGGSGRSWGPHSRGSGANPREHLHSASRGRKPPDSVRHVCRKPVVSLC